MGDIYKKTITPEEISGFPVFVYGGDVVVIEEPSKVEEAVKYLEAHTCVGFDTETRPAFKKGEYHAVSLLQLAVHERVYLFRLNKCGFPASLKQLLSDNKILKIGVGIRDDIKALQRLGSFVPGFCRGLRNRGKIFFKVNGDYFSRSDFEAPAYIQLGIASTDGTADPLCFYRCLGGVADV